jgi:hypothetical protein
MHRLSLAGVTLLLAVLVFQRNDAGDAAAACGCLGFFGIFIVVLIALHIAILVWVARDAKNRGMENAILWMLLVFIFGLIGLIIYFFAREQGNLVPCGHCGKKRLQLGARCPHCGNP